MLSFPEHDQFETRGLDIETAAQLGASFQRDRWIFEYRSRGELLSRKIRTLDKKFWFEPSGALLRFWNLDAVRDLPCRPAEALVITEGEFDCIAVAQAYGGFAVSVPNGAPGKRSEGGVLVTEDTGYSYLWGPDQKLIPELDQFDKIILATDDDEKGRLLRDELAIRIGEARCWYVEYPASCKDANDVLMRNGVEALRKLISEARPLRPGYLRKPSDIPPRALSIAYSSGWECLDKHLMLRRPELVIVTGQPGHGKSQWVRSLCFHQAEAHRLRTAFLAFEDSTDVLKRDMRRFALRNTPHAKVNEQREADAWIDQHFRISTPPEDEALSLRFVENEMESAALHHDCQIFCFDPWNEVSHLNRDRISETEYIGESLVTLKRKARRLGMILIIIAHPTKLKDGEKATLYSISGSANWRNKADHGIIVHKEFEDSRLVEIRIEKSKDHETMGIPGSVEMQFDRMKADYLPVTKSEAAG